MASKNEVTYPFVLSVTDKIHVGHILVRQSDDNTQVFDVKLVDKGKVRSFDDLTPFFCLFPRGTTGQGLTEEIVQEFDGKKGTFKYTLSPNAWQFVGRNEAYFSFRKQLENGTWDEQYSTKMFTYQVEKSIYQTEFRDSNYWFTFKELKEQFGKWIDSSKNYWNNFLESVKNTIESIDGGGNVLEISEFKFSKFFNRWFKTMKDRADYIEETISKYGVLIDWFGAVGDGVTDDTEAIQKAVDYCAKNNLVATTSQNKTYMIKAHIDRTSTEEKMTFLHNAGGVLLPDNAWLHFAKNSRFKAITNSDYAYNIVRTYGGKKIKITGDGTLEGDGDSHTGDSGEFGHGLAIFGGEDIEVHGLKAINCWGDGFVTDVLDETKNEPVKNMSMFDCHADKNGRNGLSLQGNIGFYAQGCSFKGSYRTLPKAGVDVEPWADISADINPMRDIVFEECEISENLSNGLISDGKYNEITLISCKVHDNGKFDIETYETDSIKLKDCDLEGSKIQLLNTNTTEFDGCNLVDTTISSEDKSWFSGGDVFFRNCTYTTTSSTPLFKCINTKKNLVRLENVNANLNFDKLLSVYADNVELYNVSTINAGGLMFGWTDSINVWGLNMHATKLVGGALISGSNKKITIMNAEVEATNYKYLVYEDSSDKILAHLNVKDSNIECESLYNKNLSGVFVELQRNSGGGFDSFDAMSGNFEKVPERSLRGIKTFTSYSNFTENSGKLKTGDLCIIFSEGKETPYKLYIFFSKSNIYEINTTKI